MTAAPGALDIAKQDNSAAARDAPGGRLLCVLRAALLCPGALGGADTF